MASGLIKDNRVKTKIYKFTNLAQYGTSNYYLTVSNAWTTAGIPNGAEILSVTITGWSGLGTVVNVGLNGDSHMWVFYQSGFGVSSSSYVEVKIAYQT